jgi:hypothetical protein
MSSTQQPQRLKVYGTCKTCQHCVLQEINEEIHRRCDKPGSTKKPGAFHQAPWPWVEEDYGCFLYNERERGDAMPQVRESALPRWAKT